MFLKEILKFFLLTLTLSSSIQSYTPALPYLGTAKIQIFLNLTTFSLKKIEKFFKILSPIIIPNYKSISLIFRLPKSSPALPTISRFQWGKDTIL
ncbi:hypothetical protein, partial [Chryseobacterium defluvii]|uniref:hypothetical protein n=1 Tax=Chryseobacterium defluvii TaxID=160396 RepID=UPI001E557C41